MRLLLTVAISFLLQTVSAQYLISAEMVGSRSELQLEATYGVPMRTGVTMFSITYMANGVHGEMDTASGLIVLPNERLAGTVPVVAYQHGTTNGPSSVPSLLTAGHDLPLIYGGRGYIVSATDYLGLGVSEGMHPYVHADTEASAGLDMLIATSEFMEQEIDVALIDHLFISGYSQGGHAAVALQRDLETNWSLIYPVTASTPMSGPYDLSGTMFDQLKSEEDYLFAAYIVYAILGYQRVYGNLYNDLEELFKDTYIPAIENFENRIWNLTELNTFILIRLAEEGDDDKLVPHRMFKDSAWNAIETDPDHPVRQAMADSDVHDWAPEAPTRLLYCTADEQVPFENALVADSTMNANGAADVKSMNMNPAFNHGQCVTPAVMESIEFFDSFVLNTAVDEHERPSEIAVYPNPAEDHFTIKWPGKDEIGTISLVDITGRTINSWVYRREINYSVSDMLPGLYFVILSTGDKTTIDKLYIR